MTISIKKIKLPKWAKITLIVLVSLFVIYLIFMVISLILASASAQDAKEEWRDWQVRYIEYLKTQYNNDANFCKVDESTFLTSDVDVSDYYNTKFNQVRYLATHNSYKTGLTNEEKFFYHYPLAGIIGKDDDYMFDTVTEQLCMGIRFIELDPNYVKDDDGNYTIECVHNDTLETNSSFINFELGLQEIKMWMDRNPDASPIIVLLEPKNARKFVDGAFDMLEKMLYSTFGQKLITPRTMMNGYSDLEEMRKADGYPTVNELKGKIMFLLHDGSNVNNYIERDPNMESSALIVAFKYGTVKNHAKYRKNAVIIIYNNPTSKNIPKAIKNDNYMVRTRIDSYNNVSEKKYKGGLDSNANFLSSDYVPRIQTKIYDYPIEDQWKDTYKAVLYEEDKTITLRYEFAEEDK